VKPLTISPRICTHICFCHPTQAITAKAKESASNRTRSQQDQTVNNVDNSVYIQQRQHFGQTEGQLITAVWQKWRFSASYDSFS